ncbi:hypothetical protein CSUI_000305 [Cystoisospora suis]|uniref:Uncharacterized protein n=1 Tax=Cystoisospora suis TaxID=483139 RepID=A0A2C6LHR3_9APIC|nr:hypothetical protein CSUI_000305 [Cystoisospora suis]
MGWLRLFGEKSIENGVGPQKTTPRTRQNGVCIAHSNGYVPSASETDETTGTPKEVERLSDSSAPEKDTAGQTGSSTCSNGYHLDGDGLPAKKEDILLLEGNHGLMYDEKCRAEFFNQVVNILEKEMLDIMYSGM